jgi:hypothetical protein
MNLIEQFSDDENIPHAIKYPKDAIDIDISYVQYIKLLAKENIDCKGFIETFGGTNLEENVSGTVKMTEQFMSGEVKLKDLEEQRSKIDFFRIADMLGTNYRNEVAAKKIEVLSKNKKNHKIFVHFGQCHIEGISGILTNQYGWKLTRTIEIDSQNPALRQKCI